MSHVKIYNTMATQRKPSRKVCCVRVCLLVRGFRHDFHVDLTIISYCSAPLL